MTVTAVMATSAMRLTTFATPIAPRRSAPTVSSSRVVALDGLAQVLQDLPRRQALALHAGQPLVLDRLELGGPARTFLDRHGVDRRADLLGGGDALELVLVPGGAGEFGSPGPAQIVDDLAEVRRQAVVLLLVHDRHQRRGVE